MAVEGETFKSFEQEQELFSIQINQVPIWERIRFRVFRKITQKGLGQAHTNGGE